MLLLFPLFALSGCSREGKFKNYPVVYDFVQNFHLADVQQEFHLVDIGTPAARRFLLSGWSRDEKASGQDVTFVWGLGEKSVLEFFLSEPRETQVTFRCLPFRFPGSPVQTISVVVNGQKVQEVTLEPEMKDYQIPLPQHALMPGKNRLEFHYAYARIAKEVLPKSTGTRQLAVAWDYVRFGTEKQQLAARPRADAETNSLYIPFGTQVDYYLLLPKESALSFDGLSVTGNPGSHLKLVVQRGGEEEQLLENLQPTEKFRAIPLPSDSQKIIRLSFRAISPGLRAAASEGVALARPSIRSQHRQRETLSSRKKPNIIVYMVDTLRADHLGCYGYQKPISPNIDAFAKDAILFENAIAQSSWTKPSIASIFTGLCPAAHGVNNADHLLPTEATTLAELLRAAGYRTAAFSTNDHISSTFGFTQGFLSFAYLAEGKGKNWNPLSDEVNQEVFSWLDAHEDKQPFFLYIHTMDPHEPYAPPQDFRENFAAHVRRPGIGSSSHVLALFKKEILANKQVIEDLISLYDAEIAFNDHNFGILLKELQRRGLYENSLIIFLSDHGDEFFEHGRLGHQQNLYGTVLNVPLIVKLPSSYSTGKKRIPDLAQHTDVLPTILDFLGVDAQELGEGHSLLPLLSVGQQEKESRVAFSYLHSYFQENNEHISSLIEGPWKLIREWRAETDNNRLELYNREQDPGEKINLVGKYPHVAKRLLSLMKAHDHAQALKPGKAVIDEELRERLKALGYVQ